MKKISIIIPAYNEEKYLKKTIDSIREQTNADCEIVVVANGCTDNTVKIAQHTADRVFNINVPNVSLARNVGAKYASGNILVFLDADTRLAPNTLEEVNHQFTDNSSVGTLYAYPNAPRFRYSIILAIKNLLHTLKLHKGSSGVIITNKRLFNHVGGFDERLHIKENSNIIKKLAAHGHYTVIRKTYATTSTRRYERWGLIRTAAFWLMNKWLFPNNAEYEPVR